MDNEYEQWRNQITRRAEMLEAASIENANAAIKALFLLNGGAAIAILGFLSATFTAAQVDPERARLIDLFILSLKWLASGAGLAVFTSCLAYLTNSAYASSLIKGNSKGDWCRGKILNFGAIVTAFGSFACFVYVIWLIGAAY